VEMAAFGDLEMTNIDLTRILCPVAFSPSSQRVVERAATLATLYDSELRLLHVRRPPDLEGGWLAMCSDEPGGSERLLTKLSTLARTLPDRVRVSTAVTDGEPAIEILRHARLMGADLLALGMHGRNGSLSPLVGAMAADAPCPVLAVQAFDDKHDTLVRRAMTTILCCVDFRPSSLATVEYACALARKCRGQVKVVHVLPERWDGPRRDGQAIDSARDFVEDQFRRLLQIALGEALGSTGDASEVVLRGSPCVEIVRLANKVRPDLIVIGIDRGRGLKPTFGTTSICIMQFAPCPVLFVPAGPFHAPPTHRRAPGARTAA
jgi:universal stress protein A